MRFITILIHQHGAGNSYQSHQRARQHPTGVDLCCSCMPRVHALSPSVLRKINQWMIRTTPAIFISLVYLTEVHPLDFVSLNHTVTNLSIWTLSRRHEDRMLNSGSLQSTERSHSPSLILLEGTTASVSSDRLPTGAVYCASRPLLPSRGGTC